MDLILWRHAEAEEPDGGMIDLDRALTRRGHQQASRMAAWLRYQLPEGTRILVSPAVRTVQTAQALECKFKQCEELLPGASSEALLQLTGWPAVKKPTLIVGHQPALGQVIARLLGMVEPECAMKKGAVWWLRRRERDGVAQAVVVTVRTPELL
jgi:phosphohistidine phosphatase